jgi:hypothetical protein
MFEIKETEMKKNCGTCNHRIRGTDSHMVCKIRNYVCRVAKTDTCSKHKGKSN